MQTLEVLGEERAVAIREATEWRKEAEQTYREARLRARDRHRKANRVLAEAAESAQKAGLKIDEVCEAIGISKQGLYQLRQAIKLWDTEHENSTDPTTTPLSQPNAEVRS